MHRAVESILDLTEKVPDSGIPGANKIIGYKERAVDLGDLLEGATFKEILYNSRQRRGFLRSIGPVVFTILARNASDKYLKASQTDFVDKMPLNIPDGIDGQVFKRIGSGTKSTVYFLNAENDQYSAAIATDRRRFPDFVDAHLFADRLLSERNYYAKVFGNEYVVAEMPFIWADNKGFNRVSTARPFVAPIRDAFLTNRSEYQSLFEENPALQFQIQKFLENFSSNQEGLLDEVPIDLLGKDNLVISGTGMETSLLLLDPHKREDLERDYDKRPTFDRLDYLNSLVS